MMKILLPILGLIFSAFIFIIIDILSMQGTVLPYGSFFQRFGSLVVIIGIWFSYRKINALYTKEEFRTDTMKALGEGTAVPIREKTLKPQKDSENIQSQKLKINLEICLLILGTLIWGYGDLLYMCI